MDLVTIISIIAGALALFGAYGVVGQIRQWRKDAREKEKDREEVRKDREEIRRSFEELRRNIRGIASYPDGLAEMPEPRRLALLRSGLKSMQDYKYDEAIGFLRGCLGAGATPGQRIALLVLIGNCFLSISRLDEAEGHYREAEVVARASDNKEGLSTTLGNMGNVYQLKGELERALEHYRQALEIHRAIGYREGEANQLGNMGIVYRIQGELDKALEHHRQALEIFEEIGARQSAEKVRENISELLGDANIKNSITSQLTVIQPDWEIVYQPLTLCSFSSPYSTISLARQPLLRLSYGDIIGF